MKGWYALKKGLTLPVLVGILVILWGISPSGASQDFFSVNKEGVISARVESLPLNTVIRELSRKVPLEMKGMALGGEQVSLSGRNYTLEEALQRLLRGYNYVLIRPERAGPVVLVVLSTAPRTAPAPDSPAPARIQTTTAPPPSAPPAAARVVQPAVQVVPQVQPAPGGEVRIISQDSRSSTSGGEDKAPGQEGAKTEGAPSQAILAPSYSSGMPDMSSAFGGSSVRVEDKAQESIPLKGSPASGATVQSSQSPSASAPSEGRAPRRRTYEPREPAP